MVMKTTEDKVPSVIEQVKKLHSYGVPEVISLPVQASLACFV